jgi:hypothetical protein
MRLVISSILAAMVAVAAPASVFAQTPTAISCAPIAAFNANTALPGRIVCAISVKTSNGAAYAGSVTRSGPNASDFSLLGNKGLLLGTFLPVGNYQVTLTAGMVAAPLVIAIAPVGQTPKAISCAPVDPLNTGTAIPGAVVCPIQVTTSDGNPFTGTLGIGPEQHTPYFALSSTVLPSNLIVAPAGPVGSGLGGPITTANTFTPQLVAAEAGGNLASYITVPVTTAPAPPPPPLPTMTISVNSGVSPVPDNAVAGTVVDTLTATSSLGGPAPSVTFSANNANFSVSGANLETNWVSPISPGSQTITITATAPGFAAAALPLTVQVIAPAH